MAPRERPTLSRERVVAEATALADEQGLAAISMRALAGRLGVVPMALYKHVADKDDLVAAMVDAAVARYPDPPEGVAGVEAVRVRVLGARQVLLAHPWLRAAVSTATTRTPTVLAHLDATAGDLVAGGYSYDLVHHAMHALGFRVWGFDPEAFVPPPTPGRPEPVVAPELPADFAERYPHIVGVALDAMSRPTGGCDEDSEFAFTLDLLLQAFERLRETGWTSASVSG